ncbi:expressed unknown protein [Seminavis robusta]|uniref:Uncharacterized protein n=1 Tax=Seminavis robusta TaxID=568900 RepID=A0A9N8HNE1_9STRA|nr:expressed unknown protein [Seminavis robusta]|eukprot:Sro986_g228120.1 n/a (192) ;mRNA; f:27232-27807
MMSLATTHTPKSRERPGIRLFWSNFRTALAVAENLPTWDACMATVVNRGELDRGWKIIVPQRLWKELRSIAKQFVHLSPRLDSGEPGNSGTLMYPLRSKEPAPFGVFLGVRGPDNTRGEICRFVDLARFQVHELVNTDKKYYTVKRNNSKKDANYTIGKRPGDTGKVFVILPERSPTPSTYGVLIHKNRFL